MKGTSLNGKINAHASKDFATVFHVRESQVEVDKRIAASRLPIVPVVRGAAANDDAFYKEVIDIPMRPKWTPDMAADEVSTHTCTETRLKQTRDGVGSVCSFHRCEWTFSPDSPAFAPHRFTRTKSSRSKSICRPFMTGTRRTGSITLSTT